MEMERKSERGKMSEVNLTKYNRHTITMIRIRNTEFCPVSCFFCWSLCLIQAHSCRHGYVEHFSLPFFLLLSFHNIHVTSKMAQKYYTFACLIVRMEIYSFLSFFLSFLLSICFHSQFLLPFFSWFQSSFFYSVI